MRIPVSLSAGVLLAAFAGGPLTSLAAQGAVPDISQQYRLDLAVPEAPALLLAGVDSDVLLRPGSLHDLALSFTSFNPEGEGFRLPRSYGVEVAPLFLQNSFSREDYVRSPALSRLRLSLATSRGKSENAATALAFGARTSIHNGTDLRTDTNYVKRIQPILHEIGKLGDSIRYAGRRFCDANDFKCLASRSSQAEPDPGPSRVTEQVACVRRALRGAEERDTITCEVSVPPAKRDPLVDRVQAFERRRDALVKELTAIRDSVVQARWNAPVFDVAAAAGLLAEDSLGSNPRVRAYAGWASWALPVQSWGQLILGARYSHEKEDGAGEWDDVLQGGVRFYLGRNAYKAFVEGGVRSPEETRWLAHGGAEIKLFNGFWATVTAGYEDQPGNEGRLLAHFSLRTAPQNARSDAK